MHPTYPAYGPHTKMNATYSIYEDNDYRLEIPASGLFRSPPSTASSVSFGRDTGATRKRARGDYFDRNSTASTASATPHWPNPFASQQAPSAFPQPSPSPFVNTRYHLAHGLDTPNDLASSLNLDHANDANWRTTWDQTQSETYNDPAHTIGPLSREHNGKKRGRASVEGQFGETWGQYVFRMAGGFARGAWDFCKDTAFQGFSAGGGTAYDMSQSHPREMDSSQSWYQVQNQDHERPDRESTPVPGEFPQEDDFFDAIEGNLEDRPAKRLQTGQSDEWVFVEPDSRTFTGYKPRRPTLSRIVSARRARPSMPRITSVNQAGSPNGPDRVRSASFASARSPQNSPAQSHTRSGSSNDAQRWSARKQKENRQNDASMSRLNKQLQAMIREGKEALATRVEIQDGRKFDDFKDEGFGEGDWNNEYSHFGGSLYGRR